MSSPVTELEAGLNAMLNLKPPGVSGSQVKNITTLCANNPQSESVLIQKIFTHFKKTPGTHKLGVLYVVDSVTRKWIEFAKQQGQQINGSAPDGTYAAGVHRVTELLPVLMNDIFQSAPEEQKEKIKKLIDIWEKGATFPNTLLEEFKRKLSTPSIQNESTTPTGSPPPGPGLPGLPGAGGVVAADAKASSSGTPNAIMEALANIARQHTTAPPVNSALQSHAPVATSYPPQPPPSNQSAIPPYQAAQQSVNPQTLPFAFPQQAFQQPTQQLPYQAQIPPAGPVANSNQPNGAAGNPAANSVDTVQQQVMLIKLLADQGIPLDKIPAIIAGMQGNVAVPHASAAPAVSLPSNLPDPSQMPYAGWGQPPRPDDSRDRAYPDARNGYRNRSRSRSPPRNWGSHGRDSPDRGRGDDRRGRGSGSDYRQRSPPGRRGPSPGAHSDPARPGEKWVEFDRTLPSGHIKVLSRTLFVGGVTCSENELRNIFTRYGQVQTCIVNKDKRHAFVKMVTRRDAVAAKEGMESGPFRTRWGVGYGPRDCSDYQTGISVIPINKLTEADRKWMLTAEYGGSGSRPIETGLVVEEPDIEIGAGVSSKAISRRMQTDKGGRHGPKSSRDEDDTKSRRNRENRDRDAQRETRPDDRVVVPPVGQPMPEFPFGIQTAPNGMPMFPPGFTFPAPGQS